MKYKFLLLSVLLFFITVSSALAAPPFSSSTITSSSTDGYIIVPMEIYYAKQNTNFTFNFHVINQSNGVPIQYNSTCFFHLYNSVGKHIYILERITVRSELFDYEIPIDKNNFTSSGTYSYIFQCNSSRFGGAFTSSLEVNDMGRVKNDSSNADLVVFYFSFAIALFFILYPLLRKEIYPSHKVSNLLLRRCMLLVGILMLLFCNGIISTIVEKSSFNLLRELFTYMWLIEFGLYLAFTFVMIATLFSLVREMNESKRKKRMGEE